MRPILLFISLLVWQGGSAQNLEQTFQLGMDSYESDNYEGALAFLNRVIYFDSTGSYLLEANLTMANCYVELGKLGQAKTHFNRAVNSTEKVRIKDSILLTKAKMEILNEQFHYALQDLFSLSGKHPDQTKLGDFYLSICFFGVNDFEGFKSSFEKLGLSATDSVRIGEISSTLEKKLSSKRVTRIKVMSYIVPGSGQIASGQIRDGINSMALLTGVMTLYLVTVREYGFLNGLIAVSPWFTRYYGGGIENAKEAALTRQAKIKDKYFREVLGIAAAYLN